MLGRLLRATAHEVAPKQEGAFQGGHVENLTDLGAALSRKSLIDALRDGTPVNLDIASDDRSHPVRDAFLGVAFGDDAAHLAAAEALCTRLASEMDGRNKDCLLLTSVHEEASGQREVIVWMFPYDLVIRRDGGRVDLQDAFSLTSGLRKAALFRGRDARTAFLSGLALDHQANHSDQKVADFWISGFLGGALQVQSREGTHLASVAFRAANKTLGADEASQEQLATAIAQLRNRSDRRWTLAEMATELIPDGPARTAFVDAIGHGPETKAPFALDQHRFDESVKFRVFKLDNGVTVSAPFMEVGQAVRIERSVDGAKLTASGTIASEGIRSRG